jgi:uncharacterized protein
VRALPVASLVELQPEHLDLLIAEKDQTDMLLIGTGKDMLPLPKLLVQHLQKAGMGFDVMNTNAAVRTYNVVIAEDRRVAALMLAVDKAYG